MVRLATLAAIAFVAACGGGSDAPPSATGIGAAGGTVSSGGASVVVPPGALSGSTPIAVAQSSTGAPSLPAGVTPFGPIFAFTPHGTSFATPATITVPFDPALVPAGTTPVLYKTNAAQAWEVVAGATVSGNTVTGQVNGFSWATVAPPPPATVTNLSAGAEWHYELVKTGSTNPATSVTTVLPSHAAVGVAVADDYPPGVLPYGACCAVGINPRDLPAFWFGDVESNAAGTHFWTTAVAPVGDVQKPDQLIGLNAELKVVRVMRKLAPTGRTKAVFTVADLTLVDGNAHAPFGNECPWVSASSKIPENLCRDVMAGRLDVTVDAWATLPNGGFITLRHAEAWARLNGFRATFFFDAATGAASDTWVWDRSSFNTQYDYYFTNRQDAIASLTNNIAVDIPLDAVATGSEFVVEVTLRASTFNRRQGESYVNASLTDPAKSAAVTFDEQDVEVVRETVPMPTPLPVPPPPPAPQPVAACSGGIDPAAGQIALGSANLDGFEQAGARADVVVTRGGGAKGAASVVLTATDGTARAGIDYRPVTAVVRFEDGEQGSRSVALPIIDNDVIDGDRTVQLALSQLGGCAALGATATATLVIHDDDTPAPVVNFQVSGTVTGLLGSGLVLRDTLGGTTTRPTADGAVVLATQVLNGTGYNIVVDTQPSNPAQACTVANGTGTITGADVTNVAITCAAVVPNGSLDASFAGTGKVSNAFPAAKAIALQADGKILAVGGMVLSRYNANGSLDTTFGSGSGKITIVANGGPLDAMQAVAVQSDGRIVVAGMTSLPTASNDDFALLRFNPDGTPDTSFNATGKVVIDFAGLADRAFAVLLQGDGSIVAAGFATLGTLATANQDVAVVRVLANGTLDPGFGTGGKATLNVAGRADFGYAAALQADGKIVVAGRVANDGGSNPDFGIVRLQANGTVDTGFGTNGIARIDFGGAVWDEASDVAIQADGGIVVGGFTQNVGVYRFALARLTTGGLPDTTFGSGGLVSTPFSGSGDFGRALALQGDGKIVVAGQVAATTANPDVGIARYLTTGGLDATFGTNGLVQVDFFGAIDNANDVLVQPDGRILAAGSARNGTTTGLGLARVVP